MTKHIYLGTHADVLGGGRPVEPDEVITDLTAADLKHPDNQRLLDEGLLAEVPTKKEARS